MISRADPKTLRLSVLGALGLGLILPILAGLLETGRTGFGYAPALGAISVSLEPWQALFTQPGVWTSIRLSLLTGLGATALATLLALGFASFAYPYLTQKHASRWLTPFLAIPHAALAIGLAFVIMPSGWIARALAPLTGMEPLSGWMWVNETWGLGLTIGLLIKELPFLLLMIVSASTQIPIQQYRRVGRSLGYSDASVWLKLIIPALWPLIRLPVMVVLAYSLSSVDMGLILGPSNPPVFAVFVLQLFSDPNLLLRLPGSAGALLQGLMVIAAFLLLWLIECACKPIGRCWARRGQRNIAAARMAPIVVGSIMLLAMMGGLAMLSMLIWSLTWRWSWPALLPTQWSLQAWQLGQSALGGTVLNTMALALITTTLALILAIAWLEAEDRGGRGRAGWAEWLIYLPLLIPQIAFLQGLNVLFLQLGLSGGLSAVIWAQALFVFPYVMITLSDPWRALDPRLARSAASLGASPIKRLLRVKLPVLLTPILTAAAIGVAVSVAQYLPTLLMGAGRVPTLTTEAVSLASGSDRRVTGVYASLQAGLPLAAYLLAFLMPSLRHRRWQKTMDTRS